MKMRKIDWIVAIIVVLVGILGNVVDAAAQQEQIRRPGAPSVQAPAPPTPVPAQTQKPTVPPPAAGTQQAQPGQLTITAPTALGSIESTRHVEFDLAASGGIEPYRFEIINEREAGDVLDRDTREDRKFFLYYPKGWKVEPGDHTVTVQVTDSSTPPLTATRVYNVKITPRVTTLTDIDEHLAIVAKGGDLNNLAGYFSNNISTYRRETKDQINALRNSVKAERNRAYLYGITTFVPLVVLIILLTVFLNYRISRTHQLMLALITRLQNPQPNREGDDPMTSRIGRTLGMFLLALVLFGGNSFAQPPVSTTPAAPGAAATTPAPIPTEPTLVSIDPDNVVQGQKNVRFVIRGTNLDKVTLAFNPEFKLKTKKDASGADVPDLKVTKAAITGTFTEIDPGTAAGTNGPGAFVGTTPVPDANNKATFYVLPKGVASYVAAQVASAKGLAHHFVQAYFQNVLGDEAGNAAYVEYAKKPSHTAVRDVLREQDTWIKGKAGEISNEVFSSRVGELEQRVKDRLAELDKTGKETREVADDTKTRVGAIEKRQPLFESAAQIGVEHAADHEPKKVGGFAGIGGKVNERRTLAEKVEAAIKQLEEKKEDKK